MLTNFEKLIYNKYLKYSRRGKPYTPRQDFSAFKEEDVSLLQKLAYMFNVYKQINVDDFLEAPFKVYESDDFIPLQFFCTQRAKKCYTVYKQQKELQNIDGEYHIQNIKESLKFIYKFCKDQNRNIKDYLLIENQSIPVFLQHLKECKIDIYVIFGFDNYQQIIDSIPTDIICLMFEDLYAEIDRCYSRYAISKRCKQVIKDGIKQLGER